MVERYSLEHFSETHLSNALTLIMPDPEGGWVKLEDYEVAISDRDKVIREIGDERNELRKLNRRVMNEQSGELRRTYDRAYQAGMEKGATL